VTDDAHLRRRSPYADAITGERFFLVVAVIAALQLILERIVS
jgi:hypothetical protein